MMRLDNKNNLLALSALLFAAGGSNTRADDPVFVIREPNRVDPETRPQPMNGPRKPPAGEHLREMTKRNGVGNPKHRKAREKPNE